MRYITNASALSWLFACSTSVAVGAMLLRVHLWSVKKVVVGMSLSDTRQTDKVRLWMSLAAERVWVR